jgi:hypothetical protein
VCGAVETEEVEDGKRLLYRVVSMLTKRMAVRLMEATSEYKFAVEGEYRHEDMEIAL